MRPSVALPARFVIFFGCRRAAAGGGRCPSAAHTKPSLLCLIIMQGSRGIGNTHALRLGELCARIAGRPLAARRPNSGGAALFWEADGDVRTRVGTCFLDITYAFGFVIRARACAPRRSAAAGLVLLRRPAPKRAAVLGVAQVVGDVRVRAQAVLFVWACAFVCGLFVCFVGVCL